VLLFVVQVFLNNDTRTHKLKLKFLGIIECGSVVSLSFLISLNVGTAFLRVVATAGTNVHTIFGGSGSQITMSVYWFIEGFRSFKFRVEGIRRMWFGWATRCFMPENTIK